MEAWSMIAKRTGKDIKVLSKQPDIPNECLYIWQLYLSLSVNCDSISYIDVDAFTRVNNLSLNRWEVDIIFAIDATKKRINNNG